MIKLRSDFSDLDNMLSIIETYTNIGNVIDRLGRIKSVINYEVHPKCSLPMDLTNFNLSFEECCLISARDAIETSKRLNKPLLLLYSGGVDSTAMLVSLMMSEDLNDLKDRLIVSMSVDSIQENPNFYYKYIQGNFKTISSLLIKDQFCSKDFIILTGDLADMTYPYRITQDALRLYGYDMMLDSWRNGNLYNKWWADSKKKTELTARDLLQKDIWWELLSDNANHAPCEVKTNFDLFWWSYFNLQWQNFYFGYTLAKLPNIDANLVDDYYKVFYAGEHFQKWSMMVGRYEYRDDDYKPQAKDFIYRYTKDRDYFSRKGKKVSLPKIMVFSSYYNKNITADYQIFDNINFEDFYNPNNSFSSIKTIT